MTIPVSKELHNEAVRLAEAVRGLAHNLWWAWNPRAQDLFKTLSVEAWTLTNHNAVAVINSLSENELIAQLYDKKIAERAAKVIEEYEQYLIDENTWAAKHCPQFKENPVAYFSAEFGIHESLPIYSGGLGILSGDHIKSASDLGVPFYGVSLFYRNGYFTQQVNADGWQEEIYPTMDPGNLPMELVVNQKGEPIVCEVTIAHTPVRFHAWRVRVGRSQLFLLDTHREENDSHWREITGRVYGGDHSTRVSQELILGVGGVRFLHKLGIKPMVYHLNEGHSAFLLLELMRELVAEGKSLDEARKLVKQKSVFTTHTPVPAGHDRFSTDLLDHLMHHWPAHLGLGSMEQFMDLGRVEKGNKEEAFCMTVLALQNTRAANAVSELNGVVSREMWKSMYDCPAEEVPIGHITNGVHILGWMNRETYSFWENSLGVTWLKHLMQTDFWEKIADPRFLSDEAIWGLRYRLKRQMIEYLRERLRAQRLRIGTPFPVQVHKILNPDALTIGFARRFATYKRAMLLFRDPDRTAALFNDPDRPVQIVFAGKAHPRDDQGKQLIQRLYQLSHDPRFFGKLVFIENYDIQLARYLVSGCDVWLNNPRRPLEASGTSGQKIAVHGGLNLSIQDGWWREGFDGSNGFAIGEDDHPDSVDKQDEQDFTNLFSALTDNVIPEYYSRDEMNIPRDWIRRIRRAMVTLIPQFNTDRMVADYTEKYYLTQEQAAELAE